MLACNQHFEVPFDNRRQAAIDAAAKTQKLMQDRGETSFVEVVDGMRLHLSSSSVTGYQGVYRVSVTPLRYEVQIRRNGATTRLGKFPNTLAAAIRFAWYCKETGSPVKAQEAR